MSLDSHAECVALEPARPMETMTSMMDVMIRLPQAMEEPEERR
jgi:hypothetical protein